MIGFSKKEILALLEKEKITDSQKNAIAEIIYRNNQRIEQDLGFILDQLLEERNSNVINDFYH